MSSDAYLEGVLRRVDRGRVVSGIGERPAVVHARTYVSPLGPEELGRLAPVARALVEKDA